VLAFFMDQTYFALQGFLGSRTQQKRKRSESLRMKGLCDVFFLNLFIIPISMNKRLLRSWIFMGLLCFFANSLLANVTAAFSSNVVSGCNPLTVNFTDLSTGSPNAWVWNFGNGNTSTLQNASAIYNTPGTYTVKLTVSDGTTTDSKSKTIVVFSNPTANFAVTPLTTCAGKPLNFANNSVSGSSPNTTNNWDFGDGTTQNTGTGNTTHTYSAGGTFPASLIVTDGNGCTGKVVVPVTVNPDPIASFTASGTFSCLPPFAVTFSNTSNTSGTVSYSWDFGDGASSTLASPAHTYTTAGSFSVKLVITQGTCIDSLVKPAYIVIKTIKARFTTDTTKVCAGQVVNFTDASIPLSATRNWTFGDGGTSTMSNPAHVYSTPGTYSVTLTAVDGNSCSNTMTKPNLITVFPIPVAKFGPGITKGCSVPFPVTFSDSSSGATAWNWTFGDGAVSTAQNPVHNYLASGTYTVSLSVTGPGGCKDSSIKKSLIVIAPPPISLTGNPLKGCIPLTVTFNDTSTAGSSPVSTYIWTYGDGTTATTTVPTTSHTYSATGVYSVMLKIITASGCLDSLIKINFVKAGTSPVANFKSAPDTICFGKPVQFTDLSTGGANGWYWTYGDGAHDTIPAPKHIFADTGTFTIQLVAMYNGCRDSLKKINLITVLPPKPQFTYQLNCANYFTVNFTNTSKKADSVVWNFGDGTKDVTNNNTPVHTYATRGPKVVTLTAFNYKTGCFDSLQMGFTIAIPQASFTSLPNPPNGCIPLNVGITSTSQDASLYSWSFGNGTSSVLAAPAVVYSSKGAFTVKLTITDVNGCTSTKVLPSYVHAFTVDLANFTAAPLTGCAPLPVQFQNASVDDSLISTWTWTFGDGSPSVSGGASPLHVYALRGTYPVTLTVKDTNGCSASVTKNNFIVATKPYPALLLDTFRCRNDLITFDASATSATTAITYNWNFGDGNTLSGAAPLVTHAYLADNLYTVTLRVVDPNGCDSTITRKIRILKPKAAFKDSTITYGCGTKQVLFTDLSTGFVNSWHWDFGNGATSTLANPFYTYTSPGVYQVKLIVTNRGGCMDTIVKDSIVVVPGPQGSFTFSPKNGCVPLKVNFTGQCTNATFYIWDFGDGTVLNNKLSSETHTYLNTIAVTPILLMGDTLPNGVLCELPATNLTGTVSANQVINVNVMPGNPIQISDDQLVPLSTTTTGGTGIGYSWTPSTGLSCTNCLSPVVSSTGGNIKYYLTVTDTVKGCANRDSVLVEFIPCEVSTLVPNVFSPNDDALNDILYVNGLCVKNTYRFTIYDRWGVEMFSTNVRHDGWDGRTLSGNLASSGVYYWIVSVDDKVYKGFVQLVR
jgi:gliding motility-associated-like protein